MPNAKDTQQKNRQAEQDRQEQAVTGAQSRAADAVNTATEAAAANAPPETTEEERARISELELENQRLREELSELKDQYLRKAADMENFRKRTQREKEEAIRFANAQLLGDVVNILDDFERAIASSESSRDFDTFHRGIQMIESQFLGLLERKYGLKRLDATGQPFDPNLHEALAGGETGEQAVVLEVYQKGYLLHDRLLRPARVRVGAPEATAAEAAAESPDGTNPTNQPTTNENT